jgi:hypothetical protein
MVSSARTVLGVSTSGGRTCSSVPESSLYTMASTDHALADL